MLNISPKSISGKIDPSKYNSFAAIGQYPLARRILLWLTIIFGVFLLFLFLPWTQNILATGQITTLRP
ncbi:MAG TPA: biotin attachment protein, partial [Flavobacteriales bacterium]|nr:biotin attachment protein [Flavobacteriales bacterium]